MELAKTLYGAESTLTSIEPKASKNTEPATKNTKKRDKHCKEHGWNNCHTTTVCKALQNKNQQKKMTRIKKTITKTSKLEDVTCHKCKKKAHYANHCPEKRSPSSINMVLPSDEQHWTSYYDVLDADSDMEAEDDLEESEINWGSDSEYDSEGDIQKITSLSDNEYEHVE